MSSIKPSSSQTIVLAHCRLMSGGASKVVEELLSQFPETQSIVTLISSSSSFVYDGKVYPVHSVIPLWARQIFSFFERHRVPLFSWLFDYRNSMPIYPLLVKLMRKKIIGLGAQKVVISSFAIAKNIVAPYTQENFESLLYLHSPMQYIHSHFDEYSQKLTGFKGWLFGTIRQRLLKRDLQPRTYDIVHTNSYYTANLARELYHVESTVIYPAIGKVFFSTKTSTQPAPYRVATGRLVRLVKEFDRIIELFNTLQIPLLIMGSGPDEVYLKSIAGPTITFLGRVGNNDERADILRHATGFINITKESFGIATAEALLCGVPVLGYNQGGTMELVDDQSGVLVDDKALEHLIEGFHAFGKKQFDRKTIQNKARETFSHQIQLS